MPPRSSFTETAGIARCCFQSGRRGSNSRPSAWKADALSTELLPQKYTVSERLPSASAARRRHRGGFATPTGFLEWEVMDSNHRRRTPADLQSAPFDRSGNFPNFLRRRRFRCRFRNSETSRPRRSPFLRPGSSLPHRLWRADGGIRTPDQLITNQLLWPTELHRQNQPFWIAKVGIKNQSRKLIGEKFLTFSSFSKNADSGRLSGDGIGCKDRKSFEQDNSFRKKYGNNMPQSPTVRTPAPEPNRSPADPAPTPII